MGEARRRKLAGTYPKKAFAESPEGQRLLRPITMKFLADIGVAPQVDGETGQVVINPLAIIEKLGLDPDGTGKAWRRGQDLPVRPTEAASMTPRPAEGRRS